MYQLQLTIKKEMEKEMEKEKEWRKDEIEKTLNSLSLSYNNILYERDLFDIFKHVTVFENYITYNQLKHNKINMALRKEFITELENKIIDFQKKYITDNNNIMFEPLTIKNKIMITSILRKIYSTVKGKSYDHLINIDHTDLSNIQIYHINKLFNS